VHRESEPEEQDGEQEDEQDERHELIPSSYRRPRTAFDYPAVGVPHLPGRAGSGRVRHCPFG
jgi:hypothetical protein